MGLLSKLRKGKKEPKSKVDAKQQRVINDANRVLSYIRSSMSYSSVGVKELVYKFGMAECQPYDAVHGRFRGDAEERVLNALTLLKERKVLGWGGRLGDQVCFLKHQLPSVVG